MKKLIGTISCLIVVSFVVAIVWYLMDLWWQNRERLRYEQTVRIIELALLQKEQNQEYSAILDAWGRPILWMHECESEKIVSRGSNPEEADDDILVRLAHDRKWISVVYSFGDCHCSFETFVD